MDIYLSVDVGSVTTKLVLMDRHCEIVSYKYLRTQGKPVAAVQEGLRQIQRDLPPGARIRGVGATGSGRYLAGVVVGADIIKNEITAQAVATLHYVPGASTVIEIGGQDSKLIILRDGVATDFAMNTVCAAGTGSFLDQQAGRLNMRIEDFSALAVESRNPVRIAGRCTVFAESDMIHKQQMGHELKDIIHGLCQAMVRNYLNNVCLGKEIVPPIVFQGGVAFNQGMIRAFNESLEAEVIVPRYHQIMGAIGMALLARDEMGASGKVTNFKGFEASELEFRSSSFECKACPNLCEVVQIASDSRILARWGGRCNKWERAHGQRIEEDAAPLGPSPEEVECV
ncbi:MAG TPA: acyl-CoA dehydratase activase [Dehalococcoidia bacterium]|nr:acyl-CoA dehydratase activase [Dehalococcoidia bacterium]